MSLITWFNQFYIYVERSHLSADAQALFLFILHIYNNERFNGPYNEGWIYPSLVEIPTPRIMKTMGWTDRRRLYKARDELKEKKLLTVHPGRGVGATCYELADENRIKEVLEEEIKKWIN